jgi:hypothetical protein
MNFDTGSDWTIDRLIADENWITRLRVNALESLRNGTWETRAPRDHSAEFEAILLGILGDLRNNFDVDQGFLPELGKMYLSEKPAKGLEAWEVRAVVNALGDAFAKEVGKNTDEGKLFKAGFVAGLTVALSRMRERQG